LDSDAGGRGGDVFRVFAQLDAVAALLDDVMATHLVTLEHESWRADGYE
jgi:hypothetical protein